MSFKLNITQIGMVLILVPIAFEIVFILSLSGLLANQEKTLDSLSHSRDAILFLQKSESSIQRAIATISVTQELTEKTKGDIDKIYNFFSKPEKASEYMKLDIFPELKLLIEEFNQYKTNVHKVVSEIKAVRDDESLSEDEKITKLRLAFGKNQNMMLTMCFEASPAMKRMIDIENRVRTAEPEELERFHWNLGLMLSLGLALSALLSAALAHIFTRDILDKLKSIGSKAQVLALGKALPKPEPGSDEFSVVEEVLHESSLRLIDGRKRELAILDNAADVLCSLDSRLKFEAASASAAKIWQYSPDELLGMSVLNLLAPDTIDNTRNAFQQIAQNKQEATVENTIRCKDRSLKDSVWTVNWSKEENKFFCVVHDVTELRAIERLKQHFLNMVSHDLRTPLASVSVSLQLLLDGKRGPLSKPLEKEIGKCKTNLEMLTNLVNDLLELEKLESGKRNIETDFVSAASICGIARDALESMAVKASVSINLPVGDAVLIADEKRLVQVVTNLLSNAIKFSPEGGEITMSIQRAGKLAEIRIADQGPGLSREDCQKVFEKFKQSSTGLKSKHKGSGLGLAIVREIVEAHDGQCGVESELGSGSAFWIRIPEFVDDGTEVAP